MLTLPFRIRENPIIIIFIFIFSYLFIFKPFLFSFVKHLFVMSIQYSILFLFPLNIMFMFCALYLLHDVFHFVLLTVQDHSPLLLVLQVLEKRAVGLVLPLILQVPHVDGRHLPLLLRCRVQNNLQRRQAWGWMKIKNLFIVSGWLIYPCILLSESIGEL